MNRFKKSLFGQSIAIFSIFVIFIPSANAKNIMKLWYTKPASEWVEALPIGNGRLGAMIYGGVTQEKIQFNEETLWTGKPHEYHNEGAVNYLDTVRQLLFEGKQIEAQNIASDHMMSVPLRQKAYQPFGDIQIFFDDHQHYKNYRRELDIENATVTVEYLVDDILYKRKYIASHPDQLIAINLSANKKASINCRIRLSSVHKISKVYSSTPSSLSLFVAVKDGALKGEARLEIHNSGGSIQIEDGEMIVNQADWVTLFLVAATNYISFRDISADPGQRCDSYLKQVRDKSFAAIYKAHFDDYQFLFNRFYIDLGSTEVIDQPTDVRIKNFNTTNDPQLIALFMQYGRYLLISSSRAGTQPANLQGIWNDLLKPPWDSKWTTNINVEMNYWPAELCNLSECHEPLFDMIDDLVVTGKKTANSHYGCKGWVFHHNTDIWRGSAPVNASNHGIWVTGGAWLCHHLWERFLFTQDKDFLANRAYPVMKKAAEFFIDFLIEDPKTGWLISAPSNSPEIGGLVSGPTMDHQIIRSLFKACINASQILNRDIEFRINLEELIDKIAPNQIGKHGQLQEWLEDKDDPNNKHRHVSHLWALHPGNEIAFGNTPELVKAARQSLLFRGDGGTGWSLAWKINFWARLHDGDHALKMIKNLLTPVAKDRNAKYISGGIYPNLFDAHPPFQIDGNFGATAGIAEMLVQSHTGEIELLPALPTDLAYGQVRGLCARGGFELNINWSNGELEQLTLYSKMGKSVKIRYVNKTIQINTSPGDIIQFDKDLERLN